MLAKPVFTSGERLETGIFKEDAMNGKYCPPGAKKGGTSVADVPMKRAVAKKAPKMKAKRNKRFFGHQ